MRSSKKTPTEASSERQELHPDFERYRNKTLADLEQQFYYELFQAQLKWASSSLQEESILDSKYRYDSRLRQLLKEIPDNYFLFYNPVLKVAQAEIDLEVVLISPTDIYCVTFIETNKNSIIHASTDRFWKVDYGKNYRKKIVSPVLSQNRMRKVVTTLLSEASIRSKIHSVIVAPDGYIDDHQAPLRALKVDCTSYNQWLGELKRHPSPLKKEANGHNSSVVECKFYEKF
ncbi:nuclease-related domain-containing protein [Geomicrobium sp. JCM 19055]|uniref:nuclease-related domain-containing protein n=1 Tax=Geomicrobium sp. JCM 19055 TaxID=1460649 RepID=UPI0005A73B47|nr:nuclease-related domain-containing protein [Geomicrobium sp. JCM 19055]